MYYVPVECPSASVAAFIGEVWHMEVMEVMQIHHPLEALMLDLVEAFTAKDVCYAYVGGQLPCYTWVSKSSAKVAVVLSKLTSNCHFVTSVFTDSDKVQGQ